MGLWELLSRSPLSRFITLILVVAIPRRGIMKLEPAIIPTHQAADAFWKYWKENGETHKHGYYESTWGAINAALRSSGVTMHHYPSEADAINNAISAQLDAEK